MAIPTPYDFTANDHATAARMDTYKDAINYLLAPPRVKVYRSANLSVADVTWVLVGWDSEEYDDTTRPSHDTATNTSRLVAPETGLYQVVYSIPWGSNATGVRTIHWRKNAAGSQTGGTFIVQHQVAAISGAQTYVTAPLEVPLTAADYLELFVFQNSGSTISVVGALGNAQASWRFVALG